MSPKDKTAELRLVDYTIRGGDIVTVKPLRLPRHTGGQQFLRGPIPWQWLATAAKLPGKTFHVAVALWFVAGFRSKPQVKLTSKLLAGLGVTRKAKYRALERLEKAGLVLLDQVEGKNPRVTIIWNLDVS
jgi:hypothetical protein